jgi:hypothetical protein
VSDELERKAPASDEGKEDEDVEAHRKAGGSMQDEGQQDDGDDVEAHRQHGGVGRQHGGA